MTSEVHQDRRQEPRLRYSWDTHIYLSDRRDNTVGRMIDLNREAAALLFNGAQDLMPGQELELGFTYPRIADGEFEIVHQHREARVLRAEPYNDQLQRIVVQFHQPLEDPPAAENEYLRY